MSRVRKSVLTIRRCVVSALLFSGFFSACTTTSKGTSTSIPLAPLEDSAYAPVLRKWLRSANVVADFQSKLDVKALFVTDEFRKAWTARAERIKGGGATTFDETSGDRLGFFVSIYTPEHDYMNLEERKIWNLEILYGASKLAPTAVKRLFEKSWFDPYFPFVNRWTQDYLVLFQVPGAVAGSAANAEFVLPRSVTLSLRSALAGVELTWE